MRHIQAVLYADNAKDYYEKLPSLPDPIQVLPCTNEAEAIKAMSGSQALCCTGMFSRKMYLQPVPSWNSFIP